MWVISAGGNAAINTEQMAFAETERQGASLSVTAHMPAKRVVLLTTNDPGLAAQALSAIFAGIAAKRRALDLRILVQAGDADQHGDGAEQPGGEEDDHADRE